MNGKTFNSARLELLASLAGLMLLAGCPPPADAPSIGEGSAAAKNNTYLAAPNKIFDGTSDFDLTWHVVYESKEKPFDPAINVTNRQMTLNRCNQCHECGFKVAFDMEHFGTPTWNPIYKADTWAPVVRRMVDMPGSFMNEQIAERIYNYLNEETQGKYDESKDPRGQNTLAGRNEEEGQARMDENVRMVPRPQR